jgi:hypothetical protein
MRIAWETMSVIAAAMAHLKKGVARVTGAAGMDAVVAEGIRSTSSTTTATDPIVEVT